MCPGATKSQHFNDLVQMAFAKKWLVRTVLQLGWSYRGRM